MYLYIHSDIWLSPSVLYNIDNLTKSKYTTITYVCNFTKSKCTTKTYVTTNKGIIILCRLSEIYLFHLRYTWPQEQSRTTSKPLKPSLSLSLSRSNPKESLHPTVQCSTVQFTDNLQVLETNISEPLQALLVLLATAPIQSPIQDLSTSKDR